MKRLKEKQIEENAIMKNLDVDGASTRAEQIVYGWSSIEKAAEEIHNGLHATLLSGSPVFLYRNSSTNSDLVQLAIVQNLDYQGNLRPDFGIGIITAGYTALYPSMPIEYLSSDLRNTIISHKVPKNILESYDQIVSTLERTIPSNNG